MYGDLLLRIRDRHDRDYCFAPTAEEVVTEIARRELRSYKQLPVNYYQINTKFRDEIRPRFGVMRAREFVMKDAYSFHLDQASLDSTYERMAEAYTRIFTRLGLRFRKVDAHGGEIGGSKSQEFHVLADSGEDQIAWCEGDSFAANVELAPALPPPSPRPAAGATLNRLPTPGVRSIDEVAAFLKISTRHCLKTLIVEGSEGGLVALCLRGDHELNPLKAERLPGIASPLRMAAPERVLAELGTPVGSLGPVGLSIPLFADHSACAMADFACGANAPDTHLTGVNWQRDLPEPAAQDLRGGRRSQPGRWRRTFHRTRRRGGTHLPAWRQVQPEHACDSPRPGRQGTRHDHGLLRYRRLADTRRSDRTEQRCQRHHLARADESV
jgi:prolyl-tRNA synthetase